MEGFFQVHVIQDREQNMSTGIKKGIRIFKDVMSWFLLAVILLSFIYVAHNIYNDMKDGTRDGVFFFGYQPIYVLSGSMEPYMMTNSVALTKQVTSMDEINVGDVVTYHIESGEGKLLRITHRIIEIDGDFIYTKGDNSPSADGFPLTIENIKAKVLFVVNLTAWIASKWETTTGKVMLISFGIGILIIIYWLNILWSKIPFPWREEDKLPESKVENDVNDKY